MNESSDKWDKLFDKVAAGYAAFAAWRFNGLQAASGVIDEASALVADYWEVVAAWYDRVMANWLQKASVIMAVFLSIVLLAMWGIFPSDQALHFGYKATMLGVALVIVVYALYLYVLQRVKPKYRLEDGKRVWNKDLQFYELDTNHLNPGWISATGFALSTFVVLVSCALAFAIFGVLDQSKTYSVAAFLFAWLAFAEVALFESLVRVIAYRASRLFAKTIPNLVDYFAIVLPFFTENDARIAREERVSALKQMITQHEKLARTTTSNWSGKAMAVISLTLFLQIWWVDVSTWVVLAIHGVLIPGILTVKSLASGTGTKEVDKLHSYYNGKLLIVNLLAVNTVLNVFVRNYYYAGYLCGIFTFVTPSGAVAGWQYYALGAIAVSVLLGAGFFSFKIAANPSVPKAVRVIGWALFVPSSLAALYLAYGLVQPRVYASANACLAATQERVAPVDQKKLIEMIRSDSDALAMQALIFLAEALEKERADKPSAPPPPPPVPPATVAPPPPPVAPPPPPVATVAAPPQTRAVRTRPSASVVASNDDDSVSAARARLRAKYLK
jgi:hypothetical protein